MKVSSISTTKRFLTESRPISLLGETAAEAAIQIDPPEIKFMSVNPGILYVMTFSVRNMTKVAQRIRIQAPKSACFSLNYIPSGPVAPGIDIRAEIECQVPESTGDLIFMDRIVATMGKYSVELPLFACKPHVVMNFPRSIDLGNVVKGSTISKEIQFQNIGDVKGSIRLTIPPDSNIKMVPLKFDFAAKGVNGDNVKVKLLFDGKLVGNNRAIIGVAIDGALEDMNIDFSAQVIDQKLSLVTGDKKGLLDMAMFGNTFYGQTKTIEALLVNSGPHALNYSINYEDEDEGGGILAALNGSNAGSLTEDQIYAKCITVSPMEGTIKGFSQVGLTITFSPVLIIPEKGFMKQLLNETKEERQISRRIIIDCPEMDQKLHLTMQGSAITAAVKVTPTTLRFGECPINDRRDILITLTNGTKFLTNYSFPTVANFKFNPSSGILQSLQTVNVIGSFLPPQLGVFKNIVHMSIADGLDTVEFRMMGESADAVKKVLIGGTDKLPIDFATQHKFVDPELEEAERLVKRKAADQKAALQLTLSTKLPKSLGSSLIGGGGAEDATVSSTNSLERDVMYGTGNTLIGDGVVALPAKYIPLNASHPHISRMEHNKKYDSFLRDSHIIREDKGKKEIHTRLVQKGGIDINDPFSVNMGMERGLDEPIIKIPTAGEPLWLANRQNRDGGSGGPNRLPIDENRLINKKYSSTPSTQAEIRDCTAELTQEQLRLVFGSHKVIDFGKVSVGSSAAKNFVVSNDLTQSVMITLDDLEPELAQSKPGCQIIPQSCIAGFDIYFSSKSIGKYKKAFTWKINGVHISKVFVVADVVPIELIMNKQSLNMEFPEDLLQQTLTQEIVLSNPGTAPAEFLWGSAGAFMCSPEKGSIGPGKSTVISITWTPQAGKRNEEELGLHITGGVDQTLKVVGILNETKAEFTDKMLKLGTMAVGTEKRVVAHVKNVGSYPLVFFITPLADQFGISMTPEQEYVPPGGVIPIEVFITPKFPMNYDNVVITAKIRGGKQISFKLNGTSVIPLLQVIEPSFSFGSVAIGSEIRLPLTISNKTGILSTLILDLTNYVDFKPFIRGVLDEIEISTQDIPLEQEDALGNQIRVLVSASGNEQLNAPPVAEEIALKRNKKRNYRNIWKITLLPNSTLMSDLIFRPTTPKQYNFKLQLYLQGIQENRSLNRDVSAVGLTSLIDVSDMVVDFGDRVVSRDPLSRISYFLETTLKNVGRVGVSYSIREQQEVTKEYGNTGFPDRSSPTAGALGSAVDSLMSEMGKQIFFVSPLKGDLAPGTSAPIRITFQPQSSGDYTKKLEIYVNGQPDPTRPYLIILCQGSGVFPRITFSKQHVQLPTVPLGITSRTWFTIMNNGYNSLRMNFKVSPNIPVPIEVTFPDGDEIGIMVEKIRVFIGAKAETPISWTGKIEFYDQDGERFFISVSGCADGCLLTNYPFIRDYAADYGFIALDDQPVKFLKKTEIAELRVLEAKRKEELRKLRSLERLKAVENKANGESGKNNKSPPRKGDAANISPSEKKTGGGRKLLRESTHSLDNSLLSQGESNQHEVIEYDKIPDRSFVDETEIRFLLKWLNKNVCRKTIDIDRFPACVIESGGDLVVDCLEQMSGKKVQFVKLSDVPGAFGDNSSSSGVHGSKGSHPIHTPGTAGGNHQHNKRSSDKNNKIIAANRLVFKMQQLLNFLINHGALLGHLNPINMVGLDDHLLAQEYELTKDLSVRYTPAMLANRRHAWEEQWLEECKKSWLDVLYQAMKAFILSRINYTDYSVMPGVVMPQKEDFTGSGNNANSTQNNKNGGTGQAGKSGKGKKNPGPYIPPELISSNVYSHPEAVLLTWAYYHIERAAHLPDLGASAVAAAVANSSAAIVAAAAAAAAKAGTSDSKTIINFSKRLTEFDSEFKDLMGFFRLFHSHIPTITSDDEPLAGYTVLEKGGIGPGGTALRKEDLFELLQQALQQLRIDFGPTMLESVQSSRSILLMVLHLFLTLPSMIPKTKVEFVGDLGSPIYKKIELKNPSKRKIIYDVTLKGNSDFSIDATSVSIPPESGVEFIVTLNAKFFDPVEAKLVFWGSKEGGVAGPSTLVFDLVSKIVGRKPVERIFRTVHLFDLEPIPLQIKNPFNKEGSFQLKLQVTQNIFSVDDVFKSASSNIPLSASISKNKKRNAEQKPLQFGNPQQDLSLLSPAERKTLEEDLEIEMLFKTPFWCNEETVAFNNPKINRALQVYMLPFLMGKYTCQLIFVDREVGEFCYEVNVDVGLPKPLDKVDFNAYTTTQTMKTLRLCSKNLAFEKAFTVLADMRIKNPNKKIKARSVLQNFVSSPIVNEETGHSNFLIDFFASFFQYRKQLSFISEYVQPLGKGLNVSIKLLKGKDKDSANGTVLSSNSSGPLKKPQKVLKTTIEDAAPDDVNPSNEMQMLNSCLLSFFPEKAGFYNTLAVIHAKDNPYDIRVMEVTAKVTMPDGKMVIEFRGPARELIFQDIPISNDSDKDWSLTAFVRGDNFFGPKSLHVPKKGNAVMQVSFQAPHSGRFEGALQLKNTEAIDSFEYGLLGMADEPLADSHLAYKLMARKMQRFQIPLKRIPVPVKKNKEKEKEKDKDKVVEFQVFSVETDLPYLTGPETVNVSDEGGQYAFTILSPVGGSFNGYIAFKDVEYPEVNIWFTVNVEVTAPAEERSITVESVVRKAVVVEITLDNTTDQPLTFDVSIQGEGLLGSPTFELPPKGAVPSANSKEASASDTYELIFSPLKAGTFVGKISFYNSKVGELWYKLYLNAISATPIVLETIESMIGTSQQIKAAVENPLAEQVVFTVNVSDPQHFSVPSDKITLSPYAQSYFLVSFKPSSLNDTVKSVITLTNPQFGEIHYEVSGIGLLPGIMSAVLVDAPLGEIGSQTIEFYNPFPHPLPLNVVLTSSFNANSVANKSHNPVLHGVRGSKANSNAAALKEKNDADDMLYSFALLMRKTTDIVIPAKTVFHIALSFSPTKLGQYESVVEVRSFVSGRNLLWCYPVRGIAEAGTKQRLAILKTPCKTQLMREDMIVLEGISKADVHALGEDLKLSDITIETNVEDRFKSLIARTFRAQPLELLSLRGDSDGAESTDSTGKQAGPTAEFGLRLRLLFEPLRTFTAKVDVVVVCRNRGKWRLQVDIDATEPEPDDKVKMMAAVGESDKVSFRLANRFLGYSKFHAYFSSKSSPHFSVWPSSGVLAPYGTEGTQFVVTFAPADYGTIEHANLIILTDDAQWNYEFRGTYPDTATIAANLLSKAGAKGKQLGSKI